VTRRQFIRLLASAAAWPLAASAQQPAMPVIGFLNSTSLDAYRPMLNAFRQGLQLSDQNVTIEYRWAEGRNDRLPAMAAELVRHQVTVMVAMDTASVLAARAATTTIPIVFYTGGDPVQLGLVTSLSRPGGNLTGVVTLAVELAAKRLQLLHELVPAANNIALLVNPTDSNVETTLKSVRAAAHDLGLQGACATSKHRTRDRGRFRSLVQIESRRGRDWP
jgi:putative tryptophan/tyrosine transport system substrate-binding protein